MTKIRKTTDPDLAKIMQWLKIENEDGGEGFYGNRNMICEGHDDGDLYALIEEVTGEPVSFLLNGDVCPYIVEVRPDRRGRGYGRAMAEFMIEYWRQKDAPVIEIECAPHTSINFWKAMGFEIYAANRAYLIISKSYDLPSDLPVVKVKIDFFPERVKWEEGVEPYHSVEMQARRASKANIKLPRRVFVFEGYRRGDGDPVVAVNIDGVEIYRDKAKYPDAVSLGVDRSAFGFCIDEIHINE